MTNSILGFLKIHFFVNYKIVNLIESVTVFEKGACQGVKGFFYATYDDHDGGLKINVDQIQKPEPW